MNYPTKESFLKDVENHKIIVHRDDGVYRHIELTSGSFNMRYEIVTFPSTLVYTGDMGTFVFERTEDMFRFFRSREGTLEINSRYWGEKCVADDIHGGMREWDTEGFRENVKYIVASQLDLEPEDIELTEEVIEEYKLEEMLAADGEHECISALLDYSGKLEMADFFDGFTGHRKTYRFIWCLYAIVWAIQQYDKYKEDE